MASNVIHRDPEIMGGVPVFVGTRVPFKALVDYLEARHDIDEFLDDFPTVTHEQVMAVIEDARKAVRDRARE